MKITVALLRDLEKQVCEEQISYSRMVEILNETAAMPELHPAITHINASPEFLSKQENVNALNKMVELAYNHGSDEKFILIEKQVDEIFLEGMNAHKLIGELPTPRVRLRQLKKKLKTK